MSMFSDRPMLVPDFVGLAYDEARALEHRFGVHIADPDPDAPPISNYWWEHQDLVVLTQAPPAGARVDRLTSVTVTLGPPEAPVGARSVAKAPPALSAEVDEDQLRGATAGQD